VIVEAQVLHESKVNEEETQQIEVKVAVDRIYVEEMFIINHVCMSNVEDIANA
jgi:hypothetical protein